MTVLHTASTLCSLKRQHFCVSIVKTLHDADINMLPVADLLALLCLLTSKINKTFWKAAYCSLKYIHVHAFPHTKFLIYRDLILSDQCCLWLWTAHLSHKLSLHSTIPPHVIADTMPFLNVSIVKMSIQLKHSVFCIMIHMPNTVPKSSEFFELVCSCPCHLGMVHPQVAEGGTASNMKGTCEYIEQAVADIRHGLVLQLGCWARR